MSEEIGSLRERIAVNERDISTAHARIDKMESLMREEFKEFRDDMKAVLGFLERAKGMVVAVTMGVTMAAGVFAWLINLITKMLFN